MTTLHLNEIKERDMLATICILLSPILSNYVFISEISFGDVMVLITLPWLFSQLRFNVSAAFYIATPLTIVFTSYVLLGGIDVYAGFYRAAFYYCIVFLIISIRKFNLPYFMEVYGGICVIVSMLIVFQWCAYTGFGISIPLQLPFEHYEQDTLNIVEHVFRTGGLFKEPSYYAIYIMPYYVFIASKGNFRDFFIISLAGVLSTSSLMFFLIVMCSVLLCLRIFGLFGMLIIVFFSTGIFGALFFNEYFNEYIFIERVHSIFIDGGTLNERFLPFIDVFNLSNFLTPSVQALNFFLSSGLWFNSGSSVMTYFGIAGLSFLVLNAYKFRFLFGALFLILIFLTHFMSGAFSYFIVIAFIFLEKRFAISLKNETH